MKKFLSLLLALTMVIGLASTSFAAIGSTDRIETMTTAIDLNNSPSLSPVKPGRVVYMPLTTDMFTWASGSSGSRYENVTLNQANRSRLRVVVTGRNSNLIKSTEIVNRNGGANVAITFADPFVSTSSRDFDLNLFMYVGSRRQADSKTPFVGTLENGKQTLSSYDDYVDVTDDKVFTTTSSIRNLQVYSATGPGVTLTVNAYTNRAYYLSVDNSIYSDDEKVLNKYRDITDVIRLYQVNMSTSGRYVTLSSYGTSYVYNANGDYIGTTNKALPFSSVYYISAKNLGSKITGTAGGDVGSGGGDTGTDSGGSDGGTSTTPPTGTINSNDMANPASKAITNAKNSGAKTAVVTFRNNQAIEFDAIRYLGTSAKNSGLGSVIYGDTTSGTAVVGRLYLYPANAGKLTGSVKLGVNTSNSTAKKTMNTFNKSFKNNIAVVSFDQDGTFGMPVHVAAKTDISKLNKQNLYFYSYNRAQNMYYRISKPSAWVDDAGYLRFNTTLAGDIIISDGPLTLK